MTSLLYVNIGEPETSGATTTVVELLKRLPKFNVKVGLEELLFSGEKGIADKFSGCSKKRKVSQKSHALQGVIYREIS